MRYLQLLLMMLCLAVPGRYASAAEPEKTINYYSADTLPLYGKVMQADGPRYRRLPESLHGVVREAVWNLACHSAGLYIRFRTDAPEIHARWTNTGHHMAHMADCGTGGLDLYTRIDGQWRFVGSAFGPGRPSKEHYKKMVGSMKPEMREYLLYLSLYDEVKTLELGIPEGYVIEQPVLESPHDARPVVMYGSSILQGGCCSRPGMAFTNILGRRFDRTVINLGFSGNAHVDLEVAEFMAQVKDPAVFVLDYCPNARPEWIDERGEAFFRILRDAHPDVPVIFVEIPQYPHTSVDEVRAEEVLSRNASQKALYQKLKKAGEKRIYYLSNDGMIGYDAEATVDGVHFTDLGMVRYADHITPVLKRALRRR